MSTRWRPLVITSNGASSARKSRLLAIAPTGQPSAAAASAAVRAEPGSSLTVAVSPAARSSRSTILLRAGSEWLSAVMGSSVGGSRIVHQQDRLGRGAEAGEGVRLVAPVAQALARAQLPLGATGADPDPAGDAR